MGQKSVLFTPSSKPNASNIGEYLQQAIEIEIATIPTYLYTYYSILRAPGQQMNPGEDSLQGNITNTLISKGMDAEKAAATAKELAMEILVFANKAGALIMSVAIEEMLHMSLSSNVKQALVGMPELYGKAPASWPAFLDGHEPQLKIDLAPLSLKQLITFLMIESPEELEHSNVLLTAFPYKTIGKFYEEINTYIKTETTTKDYHPERPQLVPGLGYYAQNNIDTIFYDKEHKPRFVNADNAGDLLNIDGPEMAQLAIKTIVDQGEGTNKSIAPALVWDNDHYIANCDCPGCDDYDDKNDTELCHYDKFYRIYCRYQRLTKTFEGHGLNFGSYFILNVPTNPKTEDYPEYIQPVSTLINALYAYLFIMIEGCYREGKNKQFEIFMFGVHKSMIFILNSLCGNINSMSYTAKDGKTYTAAATYEAYTFTPYDSGNKNSKTPKQQLLALYTIAQAQYPAILYLSQRFQDLPDVLA